MNILQFLSGRKTYIIAVLVALVAAAQYLGYISTEAAVVLYGLLGAGGIATTRAAIAKASYK
jgi:hypothetical protein